MATYRFRTTFEDYEDIIRDLEIKSTQTFEDLHHAIHSSIGFDGSKPASFFLSDDNWKKGKEITTRNVSGEDEAALNVKNARLCDHIIDPHQKIYYTFDPATPWTFRIELVKISRDEENGVMYPRCVRATGEAPKQYTTSTLAALPVPEDFDLTEDVDDDIDELETETLEVEAEDLPEGEEKVGEFTSETEDSSEDFETADEPRDEESREESDDF